MEHEFMRKMPAASRRPAKNTTGIPDKMKQQYEAYSGMSFDGVRVHYNSDKPLQMQALAYTQADHVYVAPGQERHLGHELGHIVQQRRGQVQPTGSLNGQAVNDSPTLEYEADMIAARVSQIPSDISLDGTQACRNVNFEHSCNGVVQRQVVIDGKPYDDYQPFLDEIFNNSDLRRYLMQMLHMKKGSPAQAEDTIMEVNESSMGEFENAVKILFSEVDETAKIIAETSDTPESLYCDGLLGEMENIRGYCGIKSFYAHLCECWLDMTRGDGEDPDQDANEVLTGNESVLQGGYGRFPTIYSYGFLNSNGTVNSANQGPHTLAHVSVNYLMDHPLKDANLLDLYASQVIPPEEVCGILDDLQIAYDKDGRAQKYVEDYNAKYNEFSMYMDNAAAMFEKPNALIRELMEMHPMAVYGWLTNIRQDASAPAKRVSSKSIQGKGERYGEEIKLDKGWRPIGGNEIYEEHMKEYLYLRLGMTVIESRLDEAVKTLMETGSYTITDADRGI